MFFSNQRAAYWHYSHFCQGKLGQKRTPSESKLRKSSSYHYSSSPKVIQIYNFSDILFSLMQMKITPYLSSIFICLNLWVFFHKHLWHVVFSRLKFCKWKFIKFISKLAIIKKVVFLLGTYLAGIILAKKILERRTNFGKGY